MFLFFYKVLSNRSGSELPDNVRQISNLLDLDVQPDVLKLRRQSQVLSDNFFSDLDIFDISTVSDKALIKVRGLETGLYSKYHHDFQSLGWHGRYSHQRILWQDQEFLDLIQDRDCVRAIFFQHKHRTDADLGSRNTLASMIIFGLANNFPSYLFSTQPNWMTSPISTSDMVHMKAPTTDPGEISRCVSEEDFSLFSSGLGVIKSVFDSLEETTLHLVDKEPVDFSRFSTSELINYFYSNVDEHNIDQLTQGEAGSSTVYLAMCMQSYEVLHRFDQFSGLPSEAMGFGLVSHALDARHLAAVLCESKHGSTSSIGKSIFSQIMGKALSPKSPDDFKVRLLMVTRLKQLCALVLENGDRLAVQDEHIPGFIFQKCNTQDRNNEKVQAYFRCFREVKALRLGSSEEDVKDETIRRMREQKYKDFESMPLLRAYKKTLQQNPRLLELFGKKLEITLRRFSKCPIGISATRGVPLLLLNREIDRLFGKAKHGQKAMRTNPGIFEDIGDLYDYYSQGGTVSLPKRFDEDPMIAGDLVSLSLNFGGRSAPEPGYIESAAEALESELHGSSFLSPDNQIFQIEQLMKSSFPYLKEEQIKSVSAQIFKEIGDYTESVFLVFYNFEDLTQDEIDRILRKTGPYGVDPTKIKKEEVWKYNQIILRRFVLPPVQCRLLVGSGTSPRIKVLPPQKLAAKYSNTKTLLAKIVQRCSDENSKVLTSILELQKAIQEQNLSEISRILSQGSIDINCNYRGQMSLFMFAVQRNDTQIISTLLDSGKVDQTSKGFALEWAVENNQIELAYALIEHGADINVLDYWGNPIFKRMCEKNMIDLILQYIPKVRSEMLNEFLGYAVENNQIEVAYALIERGADVNVELRDGVSIFQRMCEKSLVGLVRLNAYKVVGMSRYFLLNKAVEYEQYDVAQALVDSIDNKSDVIIHLCRLGDIKTLKYLLQYPRFVGMEPEAISGVLNIELYNAVSSRNYSLAEVLLRHGADPHFKSSTGEELVRIAFDSKMTN